MSRFTDKYKKILQLQISLAKAYRSVGHGGARGPQALGGGGTKGGTAVGVPANTFLLFLKIILKISEFFEFSNIVSKFSNIFLKLSTKF